MRLSWHHKSELLLCLRRVREACLETIQEEMAEQQMIPVQSELLRPQEQKSRSVQPGLDICNLRSSVSAVAFLNGRLAEQNGHPFNADYLRLIITV